MAAPCPSHVGRVRKLYKLILQLHKSLPTDLRAVGDQYVKDEFRRHKSCEPQFVPVFMNEWTNYALTIVRQLNDRKQSGILGKELDKNEMGFLREDQIGQLFELFQETQKPVKQDKENTS